MLTWTIIGLLAALALGALAMFHWLKDRGETAEARTWATWDDILIFIQPMYGAEYAAETVAQHERAVSMLKKHGNRLLDVEHEVLCWTHRATPHNTKLNFQEWREQCRTDERKFKEGFDLKKATQAVAAGKILQLAAFRATGIMPSDNGEPVDFERNENGQL